MDAMVKMLGVFGWLLMGGAQPGKYVVAKDTETLNDGVKLLLKVLY